MAWNLTTPFLLVQQPPGSENWCLGCVGTKTSASEPGGNGTVLPNGIYDSLGTQVTPPSLYLAQLCERLGPTALTNIGYKSSFCVSQGTADFSISATPGSQTLTAGNSTRYSVTVTPMNGFASTVNLTVAGLPPGASGTFNPISISGSESSTLNISTSACSTPAGTYGLTITGASGSLSHMTLVVTAPAADFTLGAMPSSQTVTVGSGTSYTVSVSPIDCFQGNVGLNVSGLPGGATGTFNPSSVTGGSGSSTLTVNTSSSTVAGTYSLTITGTSGSLTHSLTVGLVVNPMGGGLPSGWTDQDIGTPGLAGSASFSNGTFAVNGGGSDIWGSSDNFNYVSQAAPGDITITTRVASQPTYGPSRE